MSQILDDASKLLTPEKRLQHSFSTGAGSAGFTRLEIASARVLIKRLVRSGLRKGPSDMLILSDTALEQWYDGEAVSYLHERYSERRPATLEIK